MHDGETFFSSSTSLTASIIPLGPHRKTIESNLADALGITLGRINLKFKTLEGLTFPSKVGDQKIVASHSIVSLEFVDNA